MKANSKKLVIGSLLLATLCWQTIQLGAQQAKDQIAVDLSLSHQDDEQVVKGMLDQTRGAEYPLLLQRFFGDEATEAADALDSNAEELIESVSSAAGEKARENLDEEIEERQKKPAPRATVVPKANTARKPSQSIPAKSSPKTSPTRKPAAKPAAKPSRSGFYNGPRSNWRPVVFGFQLVAQDGAPENGKFDVKLSESDKGLRAAAEDKKTFETKDAKATRTQKAETNYTKDGTTFGIEIKHTEVIEAVSKANGANFRKETTLLWGAEVAACPDINGVTSGTGKAKVSTKTVFTDGAQPMTISTDFDLQAKLTGHVNDQAEMTHYDLQLDAYTTNAGYEDALKRDLIKEIKIKDGKYGLHYDVTGNTIEVSDGTYRGNRTPAKMGKATAHTLTPMSGADTTVIRSAISPMVPSIWNSANDMYETAQENWKNYGCVEVSCKAPKQSLKPGEEVTISTETVHLKDGGKIKAELSAEAYPGAVTPEAQSGAPGATFTFTKEGEGSAYFNVKSVSKRGIGKGDIQFLHELEEPSEDGAWVGTVTARRRKYEEREKRSGANLEENGGYLELMTDVRLKLTGRLDRTVEATNANIANLSGDQVQVDHEYDKYKVDEGYCGPNAVPYKGPKEITRTSTTKAEFKKETRVFVEADRTNGTISFSLPETNGRTVHSYVHTSPCDVHDKANTNEAIDEEVATVGGDFSFSFPIDPAQKTIRGSITVNAEDGTETEYTWELRRNQPGK
ncbi:MAG TPA: hypothetical protein VF600_16890 [Abditibacteriaceae bacterium]|jgi:hypothetical protein